MSRILWTHSVTPPADAPVEDRVYEVYDPPLVVRRTRAIPGPNRRLVELPDRRAYRSLSRAGVLLSAAGLPAREALEPFLEADRLQAGIYCAADPGPQNYRAAKELAGVKEGFAEGFRKHHHPKVYFTQLANLPAARLAIFLDLRGPANVFTHSTAGALHALEQAEHDLAAGVVDAAHASGYAHTNDAWHFTKGRPDGAAVVAAMEGALSDAGLDAGAIDAVSAHGTSTRMNDALETAAVKRVFGARAHEVPVTALKSQLGHCVVAASAVEAISCLLMLGDQRLAPTINYREDEIDPDCDLDYVPNRSRPARLKRVLSNSFGFGGHNACVVFEEAG